MKKGIFIGVIICCIIIICSILAYMALHETGGITNLKSKLPIIIKNRIHPSLPEFVFISYGFKKENFYSTNKIEVYNGKKIVQEITFNNTETLDTESLGIIIEDMNFDGYKDLRIQQFTPASPNIPYYYWLWDTKTAQFISNKKLAEITAPEFNQQNKTIKSYVRDGAATHYELTYKYIRGIPTLVKEKKSDADPEKNVLHVTISELRNGEMIVTKEYDEPLPD